MIQNPPPLQDLKKIGGPIRNPNQEHRESLSNLEKLAVWITEHVGTMGFFLIIFAWTVFWIGWNTWGPMQNRFDPLPRFALWVFISNIIQIFMMPLIMVGQNLQSRHSEYRAEADYEVNIKAEAEIEAILAHLELQNQLIFSILGRLEADKKIKNETTEK
ncbi:MAG TPA: DUF1003 domain-containing protein [Methylomirabilota bacterium]|jgi:uncharacterized membrane protein|nr:DUF1003 domain-containing protein [Methylomirabilota bacterium]